MPEYRKPTLWLWLFLVFLATGLGLVFPWNGARAFQEEEPPSQPLKIVTKEISPFVIQEEERLAGFSIDLWKEIAAAANLPYEFVVVDSVTEQLRAVADGEADAAIAAISMTPEREALLDFSYPYYKSGLQIMTLGRPPSRLGLLINLFFSPVFLAAASAFFIIIFFVGNLIWLLERKNNPDFPLGYWAGVWEGIWWAAVTVTTVGYGDRTVKDVIGRIMAIFWMFAGLFLVANFTATITAELTTNQLQSAINGVDDLRGKRVTAVSGTTGAAYLRENQIPYHGVTEIEEAYAQLESGEIDAIVYDAPVLHYYAATSGNPSLQVVGPLLRPEDYGIALPAGSPYREEINRALLRLVEDGTYTELLNKWAVATEGS